MSKLIQYSCTEHAGVKVRTEVMMSLETRESQSHKAEVLICNHVSFREPRSDYCGPA